MPRARIRVRLRGPWALVVGMVCFGIATYQFLMSQTLAAEGVRTEATVVAVDSRRSYSTEGFRRRTYALTVEFTGARGERHREQTAYGESYGRWRSGDQIEIVYNPHNPSELALDSWYDLWAMPLGFAFAGAVACCGFLFAPARRAAA